MYTARLADRIMPLERYDRFRQELQGYHGEFDATKEALPRGQVRLTCCRIWLDRNLEGLKPQEDVVAVWRGVLHNYCERSGFTVIA
jgi:hypothetical protein